jgi:ARG/rhodanese/phosphatase superfamily protein
MWRDGLTVIALESRLPNRAPDYLTLEDAATGKAIDVHEAAQQTVPSVEAVTGPKPVLILGGDTIVGGAQNRIINITILLKAAATTQIPVSCLEAHRWDTGVHFRSARPVDHALRRMVAEQVSRGARSAEHPAAQLFAADQGALWHEIGERQVRAAMHSPTQALHDIYTREEASLAAFVRAFPIPSGTRGVAIGLFDRLVGLDVFDSTETLERQWPRLVASAASALLDQQRAIEAGAAPKPRHQHLDSGALDRMLARAASALTDAAVAPSVGLGSDVRFSSPKLLGTALIHDRRAVHVALFRPA